MVDVAVVSPKYQIVIPKRTRETWRIKPGNKVGFIPVGKDVHLVKDSPLKSIRGIARGVNSDFCKEREEEDRTMNGEL
ncbi:MAG: AbrB/MazE/SpoVT family DNA-binding domain-containing protein [Spirochaetaceae bacterium]|jgi:AbrB family looped-hinge helix DNA binding protein|nr:AbrB/MazE/SpoVT family DNA-binding domain-containing protein [Spirochaetaceae bacterium]